MSIETLFCIVKTLVVIYFMAIAWSIAGSLRKMANRK